MDVVKKKFNIKTTGSGTLAFLESGRDVPFPIQRVYYIYDLADGAHRGFHAHKTLQQYLICIHGSCKILLDQGSEREIISLASPDVGLYVGPGTWREMYDFSPGAVLLVLASDYYEESDYIRDYGQFLKYIETEHDERRLLEACKGSGNR